MVFAHGKGEMVIFVQEIKEADLREVELGLVFREYVFYSALEVNDSLVAVLGVDILSTLLES